uniref:Transcription factor IIIB 50 kDa subunit n=1 Tax=Fagus sylvatica TaxID=28930 RepID=A0A2N9FMR6_FAGSY
MSTTDLRSCTSCRSKSIIDDEITGSLVCNSCGLVLSFDGYDAQIGGLTGPQGTFVRLGTAGTGTVYTYKEKKIYDAQNLIDDFVYKLGLSSSKSNDIKNMIAKITENEFGQGDWFPILIGACAYIVMRQDNKSLPIAEVASVIGCDIYELGRMVTRAVDFLELKGLDEFPEFDIVATFERAVRNYPGFSGLGRDVMERMRKQGVFLIQCAVKWFLTTGRRPLPVVVAVLVVVAELNEVDLRIEDVAKEIHATVSTCRLRYKELLESLVKVAQVLPWGKDVTVKNVVRNAPFVIQYMERKSMGKRGEKRKEVEEEEEGVGFDLGDVVSDCLRKNVEYGSDGKSLENDSQYFEVEANSGFARFGGEDLDKMKGGEVLIFLRVAIGGMENQELSKKLLLKQILEKDVGLDALPPSFVNGCRASKRRREKINAAKLRINRIKHPSGTDLCESGDIGLSESECVRAGKKRRKRQTNDIDWEDFIIETLLLHEVKEEEIEKGYYNTLLDLHVFNAGILPEDPAWKA